MCTNWLIFSKGFFFVLSGLVNQSKKFPVLVYVGSSLVFSIYFGRNKTPLAHLML